MEAINRSLYLFFNAGDHPSAAVLWLATMLARELIGVLPLLLLGLWLWGGRVARTAVLTAVLSVLLALLCNVTIGAFSMHPRPFMIPLGHTWMWHKAETSFPSDHAAIFFAIGLGLLFGGLRRVGAAVALLGIAVGWSRVYLGVHFPFDIIGALLVAIASAWAVVALLGAKALNARVLEGAERVYHRVFAVPIGKGWLRR